MQSRPHYLKQWRSCVDTVATAAKKHRDTYDEWGRNRLELKIEYRGKLCRYPVTWHFYICMWNLILRSGFLTNVPEAITQFI